MAVDRPIRMYGQPSELPPVAWDEVEDALAGALLYWVVAPSRGWPHPRPVWGVWLDGRLLVSVGSPALRRALVDDDRITIHLESATEVVIVEGRVVESRDGAPGVAAYDVKYDYAYDVEAYGELVSVAPVKILAWRAAGDGGRDGFTAGAAWTLDVS